MHRRLSLFLLIILFSGLVFQPVSAQAGGPVYIVQAGDTLSLIASRFNVTLNDLITANPSIDPNFLSEGQQIIIPGLEGLTGVLETEVIAFGDSLRSLSRRTQVSDIQLRKLNRLVSPTELYVGVSLIIPTQEEQTELNTRTSPSTGESLFELAIRQGSDAWTLAAVNKLGGTWNALPGDILYSPVNGGEGNASGLPSAFVSAEIRDLPIKQGGTGVIAVKTIPEVTLSGILVDRPLHFFLAEDGTQIALQGVHALLEPGTHPLRLEATLPDGSKQSYEQSILIVSGNYPEDPLLSVDPSTIDPSATKPELEQVEQVTRPATSTKYWSGDFTSPAIAYAESTYFTSRYGSRRFYVGTGTQLQAEGFHTGLDFGGGVGLAITAPAPGMVVFAGPLTVRGNATIIDHGWGVYSGFWHQSEIRVQVGQMVQQNEVIGLVGGTGRLTGPHLHWELWVNGIQVDPLDWLNKVYP